MKTILDAGCLGEGEMCHGQKLDMIDMIGTFVYVRLYIYIYISDICLYFHMLHVL